MTVLNDLVLVQGYNLHCSYRFSESDLYAYEWLDESPADGEAEIERLKGLLKDEIVVCDDPELDEIWTEYKRKNNL